MDRGSSKKSQFLTAHGLHQVIGKQVGLQDAAPKKGSYLAVTNST
jgi:hypothetical protein